MFEEEDVLGWVHEGGLSVEKLWRRIRQKGGARGGVAMRASIGGWPDGAEGSLVAIGKIGLVCKVFGMVKEQGGGR